MSLAFRQVHLDFHTSEAIAGVGAQFDPDEFAATLHKARVNSVTCFARCHHGWLYYDSKRWPERVHPNLARRDLLPEQIRACHKRGIRVPIYITVEWDHYTSQRHPDWCMLDADGRISGTPPWKPGFYRRLCYNSPYVDLLREMTREVVETFAPADGLFFDIVGTFECSCRHCTEKMIVRGLNPADRVQRLRFAHDTNDEFKLGFTQYLRDLRMDGTIFYNSGHVGPAQRPSMPAFTHWEVESLPSGAWGYTHFPLSIGYARTLGLENLGMTGKFHTAWGDFHSLKNPAALEFECFRMLALGARCSVGDQLHPSGRISPETYGLIGGVYRQVEKKEPWCEGARPLADIGVITPEAFLLDHKNVTPATAGAVRMLQECAHAYDILDGQSDFSAYRLLILPDEVPVDAALQRKLDAYLKQGGKLIATFQSGLNPAKDAFALKALGVRLRPNPTRDEEGALARGRGYPGNNYAEYVLPHGAMAAGLPPVEYAMYWKGVEILAERGTDTLADTLASYFDRTWEHFCSHLQTPSSGRKDYPAITRRGDAIYFAHAIFALYFKRAPRWCRTLLENAIELLLPEPLLRHDGPSSLLTSVTEQPALRRRVVHLLHYIPERRGADIDIIEDVIPLHDLKVSLRCDGPVATVRCVPENKALPFRRKRGRVEFTLPVLNGHQMIEVAGR